MPHIKNNLIALFGWLSFMIILGVFDNFQHIDPQIYVFAVIISVIFIIVPQLARENIWMSSILVSSIYTIIYLLSHDLQSFDTFILFLGNTSMLVIYSILMRQSSQSIHTLDTVANDLFLGNMNNQILDYNQGIVIAEKELERARRFNHAMSIVFCKLPAKIEDFSLLAMTNQVQWKLSKQLGNHYQQSYLVRMINSLTYSSDIIIKCKDGILICLPENTQSDANIFIDKVSQLVEENMGVQLIAGVATYPNEALAIEELVKIAIRKTTTWHSTKKDVDKTISYRSGDLAVNTQRRFEIELETDWVNRLPSVSVHQRRAYEKIKRVIEIIIVFMFIPIIFPTMILIALAIYLDDQDDIFYMQPRTGYNGERFNMYKFRTMKKNSQSVSVQAIEVNGVLRYYWPQKNDEDERITRVGRILRKTSLDELPQLFNILQGHMSFVGPRPTSWSLDKYTNHQTTRLTVRPGITGLWQVFDRKASNFDERIIWDIKYIEKMNPVLDLQILLMTVTAVFKRHGA